MEINQYAVTASEMKDLSFLDIDQYVSAGVYQSQKVPVSLVKAYMLSENIEQILLADMQALALAGDLVSLKNYLIDDGSTLYLTMAAGGVGNQIYQFAIDVTSGAFGTFDLVTGVFTPVAGGSQTLEDTLINGNTSGANDIQFDATYGLEFDNLSRLREGTIDAGLGGAKGVAQICAVGYELKWEAGRLYVMGDGGTTIRLSLYNFATAPTPTDDSTKGYVAGSRWVLDDGTIYTCLNAVSGIWVQESNVPDLQQVTDAGATTTVGLTVDNGTESVVIKHDQIKIVNALGVDAVITSPTLATTTNFEIPNKAGGTETFAMLSDIVAGSGDVVGPASAVDNNIATFDGTTGKLIQDGGTTIADINTNAVDRITVKLAESITKGQAVYISGANGTNILVSKASNLTEATSSKTLGLLETTGATNAIVNVITSGLIDGINTSAATIGDAVWLGTSGNLLFGLASKPYAPAHLVYIGVVSRVSATVGEIIVKVQNGFELKEIHDVSAQTPANKNGLFYNTSTSLWEARAVAATDIDANVSNVEFGYLDGVSSSIQTQINGKISATSTDTLTNKRITTRSGTVASSATPTINTDNVDYYSITALAAAITSFTTNLSGTPTIGQTLWISIKDNGTARAITWGASFESSTIALPTTTVISTRLDVAFIWNEATSVWRCVGTC